jgi:hypothetical protein
MKNPKPNAPPATLAFTHEELVIINNALNEVCHGLSIDNDEFQTRIGYPQSMAENLLKKITKALAK